jgi:hypothetical protein
MTILHWEDLPKKMSTEEWASHQADGAPPGTYMTNLSEEHQRLWRAKLVGGKVGPRCVEIRRTCHGAQVVVVVSLGGFREKTFEGMQNVLPEKNLKVSQNGVSYFDWDELSELMQAIGEAKAKLEKLEMENGAV